MNRRSFLALLASVPLASRLPFVKNADAGVLTAYVTPLEADAYVHGIRRCGEMSFVVSGWDTGALDVQGESPMRIEFPNGEACEFQARITDVHAEGDLQRVSLEPTGPIRFSDSEIYTGEVLDCEPLPARGLTLFRDGQALGEVQEIVPPSLEREAWEVL